MISFGRFGSLYAVEYSLGQGTHTRVSLLSSTYSSTYCENCSDFHLPSFGCLEARKITARLSDSNESIPLGLMTNVTCLNIVMRPAQCICVCGTSRATFCFLLFPLKEIVPSTVFRFSRRWHTKKCYEMVRDHSDLRVPRCLAHHSANTAVGWWATQTQVETCTRVRGIHRGDSEASLQMEQTPVCAAVDQTPSNPVSPPPLTTRSWIQPDFEYCRIRPPT